MENEVTIKWVPEDIQTLRPEWSSEKCAAALQDMRKTLQERSIEAGWDVIECLLPSEGENHEA